MSPDFSAMTAMFSNTTAATPAASGFTEAWAQAANEGVVAPTTQSNWPKTFLNIAKAGSAVSGIASGIGNIRGELAAKDLAIKRSQEAAYQKTQKGLKAASSARAYSAASGSLPSVGSNLLAELESITNASRDALNEVRAGRIEAFSAKQRAMRYGAKIPNDVLKAILAGDNIDLDKIYGKDKL